MKRPSLKFDAAAIGDFLLAHGEKFVMAVVALGAAGLIWTAVNAVRFKSVQPGQTPKEIEGLAAEANRHIAAAPRPPADDSRKPGQLAEAIDPWRPPVKPAAAPQLAPLDRPLYRELAKRTKPEVFPIESLQAVSGIAIVAKGEAAQSQIVPYIVVTGLIPAARQKQEFTRRFGSASHRNEDTDVPFWDVYRVERMQVVPGAAGTWKNMEATKAAPPGKGEAGGGGGGAADVPPAFLLAAGETDNAYAAPLPTRQDAPWGATAFHPWFLPKLRRSLEERAPETDAGRQVVAMAPDKLAAAPLEFVNRIGTLTGARFFGDPERVKNAGVVAHGVKFGNPEVSFAVGEVGATTAPVFVVSDRWARALSLGEGLPADTACTLRVRVERLGSTPVVRILGFTPLGADGQPGEERADPDPTPLQMAAGEGQAAGGAAGSDAGAERTEFRLFRFVDTSVKPGQEYRYRVRFAIRNPNHSVDQQHLADPALAKDPFLLSPASNETVAVAVPDPTAILVRTLKKEKLKRLKPGAVEILVLADSQQTGGYALRSLITEPGGLANVDSRLNKPGDLRTQGEDFATERVLVDVRGRQEDRVEQAKTTGVPEVIEMLFVRPDGSCDVVSAADSQERFDRYADTLPAAEDRKGKGKTTPDADATNPFGIPFPGAPKP